MSQTIKLKRGTSTPTTSNLVSGEVAIDTSAKKFYINDAGTIKEIGGLGTISVSDIPNLPASKITSGTFAAARIPSLAASKITSGTFDAARIPTLSQYLRSNANDTTTGNITIQKTTPRILLKDNNGSSGSYPEIEFETTNNQGVKLYHNEFDGELPATGYGLVLAESDTNTQFPTTGTLSFNVLGEMYAGGTTLSSLNKVFHDGYHPNADKWTTPRSHTVTLTGEVTGTATQSVDGTGNKTWSIATTIDNDSLNDQYVQQLSDGSSPNYQTPSSRRVNPTTSNPTNEHYAITTYGNGGNVTGQLATHFQTGATYNRAYNNSWSAWSRMFDDEYHPNADTWTTGRSHTVTLAGDVTGTATQTVNGSANKTWTISATVADDSHNHVFNNIDITALTNTTNLNDLNTPHLYRWSNSQPTNSPDDYTYMMVVKDTGQPQQWAFTYGGASNSVKLYGRRRTNGTWDASWTQFFSDHYHPNADKWTTPRTHAVTLTGDVTGTASQSVDGTGNKTWSIATSLSDTYLTSYTETDTLDSVTDRGATTANDIQVGHLGVDGASNATYPLYVHGHIAQGSGSIYAFGDIVIGNGALKKGSTTYISSSGVLSNVTANASIINSGTLGTARIPNLAASKITSGTFATARIPTLSQYLRSDADDTTTGRLTFSDNGYAIGNELHVWKRDYSVTSGSPQDLLYRDGSALPNGGAYRVQAHIPGTGTDQSATAVFWNQNGTWKVNVTYQSGTSSNHPEFIVGSNGKPQISIDHSSTYGISVLHERLELGEGTGTDNKSGFGADGYMSEVLGVLRHNPNGGSNFTAGNQVFHDGYHPNADKLTTARTIAGSSFDGTANISINYNNLTNKPTIPTVGNGTLTVTAGTSLSGGGSFTANQSGNSSVTLNVETPANAPGNWSDVVAWNSGLVKHGSVEIHGSGYLRAVYLNMSHAAGTRSSDTIFYSSNDNYIRKTNATGMRAALDLYTKGQVDALIPTVPSVGNGTLTVTAGTALTGGGSFTANQSGNSSVTINHGDTSSQSSVNNSGNTVIQDITLDTHGHITGITSKALSIPAAPANATITITAGTNLTGGGNFTTNQSSNETITINHEDVSSQGSVNNSGGTAIQDIGLNANGHVTSIGSVDLDGRYLRKDDGNFNWTRLGYGTSGTGYWHKLAEVTINGAYKDYQLSCEWTDRYIRGELRIHIHSDNDSTADVWNAMVIQNGVSHRKSLSNFKYYKSGSTVQVWIYTPGWREWDYYRTDAVTEGTPSITWYKEGDSGVGKTTTEPSGLTQFTDYSPWNALNDGASSGLDADLLDGQQGSHYLNYNNLSNKPTIPSVGNGTLTVTAGTAMTGGGSFTANQSGNSSVTINHGDTSSQASVNNSGNTVIQDITLDTHGHITGITSKALSIPSTADFVNVTSTQAISGFKRFNGNLSVADSVQHEGDSDTKIDFTANRVRIYAGNTVKFDSNNTYLTANSNITTGNITTYTSNGDTSTAKINIGRGGALTFYGNQANEHSIMSRNASGAIADDIRINSYGALFINLDSNNNNTSSADFKIGKHGGGTNTINDVLFTVSGETGQVRATDGTSSAPTYSFSADQDLGLFRYGGDVLGITAGGTRRARFGSSIYLESSDVRINEYLYHNGDTNTYIRYTGDRIRMVAGGVTFMDMVEGATDYLRFNTRGVTIGSNTAPQATFTVDQSCTETPANGCGTGRDAHIKLENTNTTGSASTCIIFNAKDSGGNMRHGAGIQFKKAIAWSANGQYPGELYFWTRPTSGDQVAAQKLDKDGNAIFKGNVTAYGSLSDRRLKENIEPIADAVAKVEQLEGVTFDYKKDGKRSTGLIAQDLEKVLPEAVYTTTDVEGTEEHKAIHYGNTVGLLVNAIKEQQQTINQLTKRIEELENGDH